MELFGENDFQDLAPKQLDEDRQRKIKLLQSEINYLKGEMNVHPKMQGLIGGSAVGMGLGLGMLGVGLGAIIGYNVAKGKEITPELREQIKMAIAQKRQQLDKLTNVEKSKSAQISGVMSSQDMLHYEYNELPFSGKWFALVGRPASNFHALVYGRPKMGKSYLSVGFAKYLSNFGKVLYIASEEGFSSTLKKKITDFGLDKANVDFGNFRDYTQIRNVLKQNDYSFVFIDSVNFINLTPQQVEDLKDENPDTAFVTIQQATKQGFARGSQEFAHNSDIIIEVVDGVAYAQGRFGPPSEMQIFDRPQVQITREPLPMGNNLTNNEGGSDDFDVSEFQEMIF